LAEKYDNSVNEVTVVVYVLLFFAVAFAYLIHDDLVAVHANIF
jgi:hypothetical protein